MYFSIKRPRAVVESTHCTTTRLQGSISFQVMLPIYKKDEFDDNNEQL